MFAARACRWRSSRAAARRRPARAAAQATSLRAGDTTATGQVLPRAVGRRRRARSRARASRLRTRSASARAAERAPATPQRGIGRRDLLPRRGLHRLGGEASGLGAGARADAATAACECSSARTDIGQGTTHDFTQIVADALGHRRRRVEVVEPDTARVPDSGPTSRRAPHGRGRPRRSRGRGRLRARWSRRGARAATMRRAAGSCARRKPRRQARRAPVPAAAWHQWDDAATRAAYPMYAWAVHVVDVEVDPVPTTARSRLRRRPRGRQRDPPHARRRTDRGRHAQGSAGRSRGGRAEGRPRSNAH